MPDVTIVYWRDIPAQDGEASCRLERIRQRAHHGLSLGLAGLGGLLCEGPPRDGERVA